MSESVTAQQVNDAKVEQAADIINQVEQLMSNINALRSQELGGFQLWLGGLPPSLEHLESALNHSSMIIKETFGIMPNN